MLVATGGVGDEAAQGEAAHVGKAARGADGGAEAEDVDDRISGKRC